jgi:hypothetical protein
VKQNFFGFLVIVLLVSHSKVWAQSSSEQVSTTKAQADPVFFDHGLRFSLLFPNLNETFQTSDFKKEQRLKYSLGVAIGAASISQEEIGASTNLALLQLNALDHQSYLIRVDASLTYGFSKKFNVKAGVNLATPVAPTNDHSAMSPGFQTSVGYQVSREFELDLGYVFMKSTFSTDGDFTNQLTYSGFEIAMSSAF